MVENLVMNLFSNLKVEELYHEEEHGGIGDLIVGSWYGVIHSKAYTEFGYYTDDTWWMDEIRECFHDDYGAIMETWKAAFESMAESDDHEVLTEVGVYLASAMYLNRNAMDVECVTQYSQAISALENFGLLFEEILADEELALQNALESMEDEADGAPLSQLREAIKGAKRYDYESAGYHIGEFLVGAFTGIYETHHDDEDD